MTTDQTLSADTAVEDQIIPPIEEGTPAVEHEEEEQTAAPEDHQNESEEAAKQEAQREHMMLAHAFLVKNKVIKYINEVGNMTVKRVGEIIMQAVSEDVMSVEEGLRMTSHVRIHNEEDKAEVIRLHKEAIVERYTADELRELMIFLNTPLGEKLIDGLATTRKEVDPVVKKWCERVMEHAVGLQKKIMLKKGPIEGLLSMLMNGNGPQVEVISESDLDKLMGSRKR